MKLGEPVYNKSCSVLTLIQSLCQSFKIRSIFIVLLGWQYPSWKDQDAGTDWFNTRTVSTCHKKKRCCLEGNLMFLIKDDEGTWIKKTMTCMDKSFIANTMQLSIKNNNCLFRFHGVFKLLVKMSGLDTSASHIGDQNQKHNILPCRSVQQGLKVS